MNETFEKILDLIGKGLVRISEHGYNELAADGISVRDVIARVVEGIVVEVEVELLEPDSGWSPYLWLEDAREALKAGDIKRASRFGRVFTLTPVAV